jgi:membrane-bound lytic murein transglycosylase D
MPTELALLPMVESAFNPLAASHARALGMWQFIPSTGKIFKLDQNWWRDERRDVIASTSAALDYLQRIYEMNGDWHLALASYNWGEGAVARAVVKNQAKGLPTDYEHLKMPKETRYYVPKLQALKNIIAQPELFGLALEPLANQPYFGTVALNHDMDVTVAAKLAEMPVPDFIALNPAYHRPLMHGNEATQLVLPADKMQTFQDNLARYQAQDKPLANWRTYSLKPGEKLDAVAARYGLSGAGLKQLNGITPRVKIKPGFNLLVPGPGAQMSPQLAAQLPKMPSEGRRVGKRRHAGKSAVHHKSTAVKYPRSHGKKR